MASIKVEHASSVEPRRAQTTVSSSSAASTGSSKVSKFGVKSGFVIPKNKLSGSLVPIFRGAGTVESHDAVEEESNKQVQRKTKWGTDLTQDATVRRGRALAYQTRVEQITQQLKSGVLEKGDNESPNQVPSDESSRHQANAQSQKLEMEKREAIGEILKLNPSYKAPSDYKPLMKEANIPIPLKLYPGLNFVGLILGPGSNTQKRLEEETGAKIRIQGTKAGSAEKGEITLSDGNDAQGAYEELYVHVSADTFEKVDAAVALIELLVTPVTGNSLVVSTTPTSVSGDGVNVLEQNQDSTSSYAMPAALVNQGVMQPMVGPMQHGLLPQGQFHQYPAPWFPVGPMRPPSGFVPPSNSSLPMPNNAIQFPSFPPNPSNVPQFLVGHPPPAAGFGLAPRNPSPVAPRLQQPPQGFQWPYFREAPSPSQGPPLRIHPIPGSQPPLTYPSLPPRPNPVLNHQVSGSQPRTTGPGPVTGSLLLSHSEPFLSVPSGPPSNRPLASSGWSASNVATPAQPMVLTQRPPVVLQPPMTSAATSPNFSITVMSGLSSGSMVSPATLPSRPNTAQLPNTLVNRPAMGPTFASVLPQGSHPASAPVPSASVASTPASLPSSAPSPALGLMPVPSSMAPPSPAPPSAFPRVPTPASGSSPAMNRSHVAPMQPVGPQGPAPVPSTSPQQLGTPNAISGSIPSFTPLKPPMSSPQSISSVTAPRPQRPSSFDFTFQPLGSHLAVSQIVPRPNDQPLKGPPMPLKPMVQSPPAPQAPSYRPAVHNSGPQFVGQGLPSSRPSNQMQPQHQVPPQSPGSVVSFSGDPSHMRHPPRSPAFPNPVPPTASLPHMGPRSFMQAPQMSNFPGPLRPRMTIPAQLQQSQFTVTIRPGSVLVPNQHYGNNPAFSSGKSASSPSGNQVYDPFSPTSVSSAQQAENPAKLRKQEDDPEYDDLMESVGVR